MTARALTRSATDPTDVIDVPPASAIDDDRAPCAMLMLFAVVFTIIVVLAALKFVNETLVFAVVACILLFIYMLKLTLFESRKQVFLPARSTRNHSLKEPFY